MRPQRSNDPCWCGSSMKFKRCHGDKAQLRRRPVRTAAVSPVRTVPESIVRPDYVLADGAISTPRGRQVHTDESLVRMRRACAVAAEVLLRAGAAVAPGVTTEQLDAIAHQAYVDLGAYPSDLLYRGPSGRSKPYPKSICTSVNGVICHGIPNARPLEHGDIVNIDVTAFIDGMHGDTSATFAVGTVGAAVEGLIESTRLATLLGVAAVAPGAPLSRIGEAVEDFARSRGYGVVHEYGGHGIGSTFHARPHINHFPERRDTDTFEVGMTFTIEPMLTTGDPRFRQADDGWAEQVVDAMPSAQFEHTVLVTGTGAEILTHTPTGDSAVGGLELLATAGVG
ncbi:MAG: type I methionyl aminopeptidase [Ilumatobacteraceae bacterium]